MTSVALNNYVHVCIGMLICIMPILICAFFLYCTVVMGGRADEREEKLLEEKYGKGNDGGNNA